MDISSRLKETSSWMSSMFGILKDPSTTSESAAFSSRLNTPVKPDISFQSSQSSTSNIDHHFLESTTVTSSSKELLRKQLSELKAKRAPKEKQNNNNSSDVQKENIEQQPLKKFKTTNDKQQPQLPNKIKTITPKTIIKDEKMNDSDEEDDEELDNKPSKKRKQIEIKKEKDEEDNNSDDDDEEFEDYDDDSSDSEIDESEEEIDIKKEKKSKIKEEDLQFSTFDFSTGKPIPTYLANKGKTSKHDQLKQAEEKEKIVNQVKKSGVGRNVVEAMKWSSALEKVQGVKVKDNVQLIKKTMKKKLKKKLKSAKEWNERIKDVKDRQDTRIKKREDNIKAKLEKNKERRMGKKQPKKSGGASNGSKPLKRAGFEGKKKNFLNKK